MGPAKADFVSILACRPASVRLGHGSRTGGVPSLPAGLWERGLRRSPGGKRYGAHRVGTENEVYFALIQEREVWVTCRTGRNQIEMFSVRDPRPPSGSPAFRQARRQLLLSIWA